MRIGINALFLNRQTTGSGQYIRHLVQELAKIGEENHYLLYLEPGLEENNDFQLPTSGFRVVRTPGPRLGRNLAKVWFEQVAFPRFCRREGVDLAHVPYFASPLAPTTPTVVTVHDLIPLLLPAYRGSVAVRLYTRLVAAAARRADLVLTDSRASKEDIVRHLRIPPERVQAIYLAADDIFRPVEDGGRLERVRDKYNLPPGYVLYLGGFDRRKNVPTLLKAFSRVVAGDLYLVVAGRLPEKDTAFFPDPRRWAQKLNLGERVVFTGWVAEEDKPALYSGALLFVFPSLYEGFGLPPLEALACGTPVVASRAGSLPEIVGEGGILIDPEDVESLVAAMRKLLSDENLRAELREKGLAHAATFSWEKTARETLEAYQQVVSNVGG